jgi:integrase
VYEAGKERAAAKLRSYLRRAYQIAIYSRLDPKQPSSLKAFGLRSNPVAAIPTIPGKARSRTLSADELKAYLAALGDTLPDKVLRLALYAGGQRMRQLLRATVADWDGERLRLFDPKGRRQTPREHLLPLGPKAVAIVDALAASAKQRSTSLLFSTYGTRPLSDFTISKRVAEIAKALGGEAFDLRDIRRTAETMLAGMKVSRDIRAQLLSHGISGVQAVHYDRHDYMDEKADTLVKWERRLDEIERGKKPAKVVNLRG